VVGRYTVVVHSGSNATTTFTTLEDVHGDSTWVPVVVAIFVVLAIAVVFNVVEKWLAARSAARAGQEEGEELAAAAAAKVRMVHAVAH
jgi:hypothetical protein